MIEDAYKAPDSKKTLILIQDAHTNNSCQINTSKTLDQILQKDSGIHFIFSEAAVGNNSLSFLRKYASLDKRKRIANSYLNRGLLHGVEYLDLTSNQNFTIWGVENPSLYFKSVETYRSVAKKRDKFQAYLDKIEVAIKALKPRIFNPFLLSFDQKYQDLLQEKLSLADYFEMLTQEAKRLDVPLQSYPHLRILKDLKHLESQIDFKKANKEQQLAVSKLSEADQKELFIASKEDHSPFRLSSDENKIGKAFFALLEEKLVKEIPQYPELAKYFHYLKQAKQIQAKEILKEQQHLEEEIFQKLSTNDDESNLLNASRNIDSLKKLLNLTLTPEDFDEYRKDKQGFDITRITGFLNRKIMDLRKDYERAVFLENGYEDIIKKCEEFYSLTYHRDMEFVKNLTDKMDKENQQKAILITGGYHSPNLKYLLKEKEISYVCLTPQVLQETNIKRYEGLLLSQRTVTVKISPLVAHSAGASYIDTGYDMGAGREIPPPNGAQEIIKDIGGERFELTRTSVLTGARMATVKEIRTLIDQANSLTQSHEASRANLLLAEAKRQLKFFEGEHSKEVRNIGELAIRIGVGFWHLGDENQAGQMVQKIWKLFEAEKDSYDKDQLRAWALLLDSKLSRSVLPEFQLKDLRHGFSNVVAVLLALEALNKGDRERVKTLLEFVDFAIRNESRGILEFHWRRNLPLIPVIGRIYWAIGKTGTATYYARRVRQILQKETKPNLYEAGVYAQLSLLEDLLGSKTEASDSRSKALQIARGHLTKIAEKDHWNVLLHEWQVDRFHDSVRDDILSDVLGVDAAFQENIPKSRGVLPEAQEILQQPTHFLLSEESAFAAFSALEMMLLCLGNSSFTPSVVRQAAEAYHAADFNEAGLELVSMVEGQKSTGDERLGRLELTRAKAILGRREEAEQIAREYTARFTNHKTGSDSLSEYEFLSLVQLWNDLGKSGEAKNLFTSVDTYRPKDNIDAEEPFDWRKKENGSAIWSLEEIQENVPELRGDGLFASNEAMIEIVSQIVKKGDLELAERYIEGMGIPSYRARAYLPLLCAYLEKGQSQEAEWILDELNAIVLREKTIRTSPDTRDVFDSQISYAAALVAMGKVGKGLEQFQQALGVLTDGRWVFDDEYYHKAYLSHGLEVFTQVAKVLASQIKSQPSAQTEPKPAHYGQYLREMLNKAATTQVPAHLPLVESLLMVLGNYEGFDSVELNVISWRLFENWFRLKGFWKNEIAITFQTIRSLEWTESVSLRKRISDIVKLLRNHNMPGLQESPHLLLFLIHPNKTKPQDKEALNQLEQALNAAPSLPAAYQNLLRVLLVRPFYRNTNKRNTDYGQHYRALKEFLKLDIVVRRIQVLGIDLRFVEKKIGELLPSGREPNAHELEEVLSSGKLLNAVANAVLGNRLRSDLSIRWTQRTLNALVYVAETKDEVLSTAFVYYLNEGNEKALEYLRSLPGNNFYGKSEPWFRGPAPLSVEVGTRTDLERLFGERREEILEDIAMHLRGFHGRRSELSDALNLADRSDQGVALFENKLRQLIREGQVERGDADILVILGNLQQLKALKGSILQTQHEGGVTIEVAQDLVDILNMGVGFGSCLDCVVGGFRQYTKSYALDLNKRIVLVRNQKSEVVARQAVALTNRGIVPLSRLYNLTLLNLQPHLNQFLDTYARSLPKEMFNQEPARIEKAYSSSIYSDLTGSVDISETAPFQLPVHTLVFTPDGPRVIGEGSSLNVTDIQLARFVGVAHQNGARMAANESWKDWGWSWKMAHSNLGDVGPDELPLFEFITGLLVNTRSLPYTTIDSFMERIIRYRSIRAISGKLTEDTAPAIASLLLIYNQQMGDYEEYPGLIEVIAHHDVKQVEAILTAIPERMTRYSFRVMRAVMTAKHPAELGLALQDNIPTLQNMISTLETYYPGEVGQSFIGYLLERLLSDSKNPVAAMRRITESIQDIHSFVTKSPSVGSFDDPTSQSEVSSVLIRVASFEDSHEKFSGVRSLISSLEKVGLSTHLSRTVSFSLSSRDDFGQIVARIAPQAPLVAAVVHDLQSHGIPEEELQGVLEVIAAQPDLAEAIQNLKAAFSDFSNSNSKIKSLEVKAVSIRDRLERSIVTVIGESARPWEKGSGFVVDKRQWRGENYYVILTNAHVVRNFEKALIKTNDKSAQIIAIAPVVIRYYDSKIETGDFAFLVVKEKDVTGPPLVPIKITTEPSEKLAVLVSGSKDTVSAGFLVRFGESVILLGGHTIGSDSGSPYLNISDNEVSAVAVNTSVGPTGQLLTPQRIGALLHAIDKQSVDAEIVPYDTELLQIVREFLVSLQGARLAAVGSPEVSRTRRFFLNVGGNLPKGFRGKLPLMKNDLSHIQILSVTKNSRDILLVVDTQTKDQYIYDVSNQALIKLRQEDKHALSRATDLTDEALKLNEKNGNPVSSPAQATAKVVLVDSFPDLVNNAFYQSLILHFSQTLTQSSQVIFVSQEDGKAERIANLARTLRVKNQSQFLSMKKEELTKLELPTGFLLADSYLDRAKALFGQDQKYFRLESPEEKDLIGVYAFTPIGSLMDLISLEQWDKAADLYNQISKGEMNGPELKNYFKIHGAILIPFVSKLIGRLVAQTYMAERAIGGAA